MITVLGPTACGKTKYAVKLAEKLKGEIISADSRQVFRKMNIGTGKDLEEYQINGKQIPYHIIDIKDPGEEYSVFEFKKDFEKAYQSIVEKGKTPILCGGTGLYLSSILQNYELKDVPLDANFHNEMQNHPHEELIQRLKKHQPLHNVTDIESKERTIRALEIALHKANEPLKNNPKIEILDTIAIFPERDIVKKRITDRLKLRLNSGMIEEVESLIQDEVPKEKLIQYGLEYKYVTLYLSGELNKIELFEKLNIAIHQFSKRQMTWFRKMQKEGVKMTII